MHKYMQSAEQQVSFNKAGGGGGRFVGPMPRDSDARNCNANKLPGDTVCTPHTLEHPIRPARVGCATRTRGESCW